MDDGSNGSLLSTTSLVVGLDGGLLHAGIAVTLWTYFGFDDLVELLAIKPLTGLYVVIGMVALGFVPAVFYAGWKVVSPAIIVAALVVLSGFGSVLVGKIRAPAGGPTPFGLYILAWVGVVVLVGVAGGVERNQNRRSTG